MSFTVLYGRRDFDSLDDNIAVNFNDLHDNMNGKFRGCERASFIHSSLLLSKTTKGNMYVNFNDYMITWMLILEV